MNQIVVQDFPRNQTKTLRSKRASRLETAQISALIDWKNGK